MVIKKQGMSVGKVSIDSEKKWGKIMQKLLKTLSYSQLVMCLGQKFLCLGWVRSGQPSLGLENFPQKSQIFQFFCLRFKKNIIVSGQKITRIRARSAP